MYRATNRALNSKDDKFVAVSGLKTSLRIRRKNTQTLDLAGQKFGKLLVLEFAGVLGTACAWHCLCECGQRRVVRTRTLRNGRTRSCGCTKGESHQMEGTREYRIWCGIKYRCLNRKCPNFKNYGGRGISIYDEWKRSFKAFYDHVGPAPSEAHSIDRFPNKNGNYEPGNVRWATQTEQANNTRANRIISFNGLSLSLSQWAREIGIQPTTLSARIKKWGTAKALSTPKTK